MPPETPLLGFDVTELTAPAFLPFNVKGFILPRLNFLLVSSRAKSNLVSSSSLFLFFLSSYSFASLILRPDSNYYFSASY